MKMKTFLIFGKVKLENDQASIRQNNYAELLGFTKFTIYSRNAPPDPSRRQNLNFFTSLVESYRAAIEPCYGESYRPCYGARGLKTGAKCGNIEFLMSV